jgi:hypothetical protein
MNTRFLETFVTLAQLENFRATARVLHATPATISLRIRSLEDELKTELVDPRGRVCSGWQRMLSMQRALCGKRQARKSWLAGSFGWA